MADQAMNRRTFLAATSGTAAMAASGTLSHLAAKPGSGAAEWRNKQSGMAYRRLGRTHFMVSEIVFGGLTVRNEEPRWRFLETGLELGINYIDTASGYGRGESEQGVAQVIDTPSKRERVFLTTKTSNWLGKSRRNAYDRVWERLNAREQARVRAEAGARIQAEGILDEYYLCNYGDWQVTQTEALYRDDVLEEWYPENISAEERRQMTGKIIAELEGSLNRLGTDYVDILIGPHGGSGADHLFSPELLEAVDQLKRQGKIRFFGVSSHNNPAKVTIAAAESEHYDMAMPAYNLSNERWMKPALEVAGKEDLGIIAMKVARAVFPDRPGNTVQPLPGLVEKMHREVPGDMHIAQKAYLWALRNPNVAGCVSSIPDKEMTRANAGLAGKGPSLAS
jgi:aryl-alcohol dehydrogenase-like predicted oxidoreductase